MGSVAAPLGLDGACAAPGPYPPKLATPCRDGQPDEQLRPGTTDDRGQAEAVKAVGLATTIEDGDMVGLLRIVIK
ncbi:MAG TPA: hypothetical protein VFC00_21605 [Micromonosporaceae bacterium]|nr:hypothetical protein [Micromonosporaceae bacterium]